MFEAYKVGIRVSLIDGVAGPLALMATRMGAANVQATALQAKLAGIKNTFKTGAMLFGAGAALAAPLVYAIDKAAQLQKQMIGIQIATRGSTADMDAMRHSIEKVAGQTVFSNVDVAKIGKMIATGTGLGASQVTGLLPTYTKFADVQLLMKGTPYEQSTSELIRLAHTAGKYKPEELAAYADTLTKASFIVPGSLTEVGHSLKYFQGIAKNALGIDDDDSILFVSLMNRLGLSGSRGGTSALAALSRSIPGVFGSGLLTGKSSEALRAMGMTDGQGHSTVFKDGKFNTFLWMGRLAEYVQREMASNPEAIARQHIMTNFQHAFGTNGAKVAALLSSKQAMEQLKLIGDDFAQYGGVDAMQAQFADQSVAQQYLNAKTNFESAMAELGITLLPMASEALKSLNSHLQAFTLWVSQNPEKVKLLEYALIGLSGSLMLGGTVNMLAAAFSTLGMVLGAVGGLSGAVASASASVGGLVFSLRGLSAVAIGASIGWVLGQIINDAANAWLTAHYGKNTEVGNAVYDWTHPDDEVKDSQTTEAANMAFLTARKKQSIVSLPKSANHNAKSAPQMIQTNVYIDGSHVATAHSRAIAKISPATSGGNSYDHGSLYPGPVSH